MKHIIPAIFITVYLTGCQQLGYSTQSPLYTHFTYMFQHANIIHLIINTYSYTTLFNKLSATIPPLRLATYTYSAALITSFCSAHPTPTVGASGMIMALLAIYITLPILGKKLTIVSQKRFYTWVTFTLLTATITSWLPAINALNHLFAFITGTLLALIENYLPRK